MHIFHRLTENDCAAELKITKLHTFHFTSGPDGGTLVGVLYKKKKEKQMSTIPNRSEGIVKVSVSPEQYIACNDVILDHNHLFL